MAKQIQARRTESNGTIAQQNASARNTLAPDWILKPNSRKNLDARPEWLKAHGENCDCETCHNFKEDKHRPQYIYNGTTCKFWRYRCPDCGWKFATYKSCNLHMGRVPNIMGFCKVKRLADSSNAVTEKSEKGKEE